MGGSVRLAPEVPRGQVLENPCPKPAKLKEKDLAGDQGPSPRAAAPRRMSLSAVPATTTWDRNDSQARGPAHVRGP
jgi:hypothetical protein